jgi:hypothetical protein
MLEKSVSDHRHKRVTVKALPGSALEVIKAEFFFVFAGRLARQYFFSPDILCSPISQAPPIAEAGRFATPPAPRPALRFAVGDQDTIRQIKF